MNFLGKSSLFLAASIFALSIFHATFWFDLGEELFLPFFIAIGRSANRSSGSLNFSPEHPHGKSATLELPQVPLASPVHPGAWENPAFHMSIAEDPVPSFPLQYDFYRESCPNAARIIRDVVRRMYSVKPSVAPALVRLFFHDCFIEGCDASVLLDPAEGIDSEKESPPNQFLKGFDVIDDIKSELESICPEVVSCADILVLAAREAILMAGGPFYPLYTGRKDSPVAFKDIATHELPSPQGDLSQTLAAFASRGFDAQETVSLLGAHSLGVTHCKFFEKRLYNFSGTGLPDPSLDPALLQELKTKCQPKSKSTGSSPLLSPCSCSGAASSALHTSDSSGRSDDESEDTTDQAVGVSSLEENGDRDFGTSYYRRLLQNKGLLYADQQLMAGEETGIWVKAYASDPALFRRDFALSMMKLSNLQTLTGSLGQVRRNCSKVVA